jgi:hypothetical protein
MERFLVAVIIGIMLFTSILFTLFRAGCEDLCPFLFSALSFKSSFGSEAKHRVSSLSGIGDKSALQA